MILAACALPLLVNLTKEPWTEFDLDTVNRSQKTCKEKYNSCLKKFVKMEEKHYYAICGEKNEIYYSFDSSD